MLGYESTSRIATAVALPLLGVIAVYLRFYLRLRISRTFVGIDDWLIVASIVLVCGHAVIQILGTLENSDKLQHVVVFMEKPTLTVIKLSVLFHYRRMFGVYEIFRKAVDALVALTIMWGLAFLFIETVIYATGSGSQNSAAQVWTSLWFAITDVLGDTLILSLPYSRLLKLQMSRGEKVGYVATFALQNVLTVMAITSLAYAAKNFHALSHAELGNGSDSNIELWTTIEVSVGVIAACLPPLGSLLRKTSGPKQLYEAVRYRLLAQPQHTQKSDGSAKPDSRELDPVLENRDFIP